MDNLEAKRLRKLINFLKKLDPKKFDFGDIRREDPDCGTVACAFGWTPKLFPKLVTVDKHGCIECRNQPPRLSATVYLFGLKWYAFIPEASFVLSRGDVTKTFKSPKPWATPKVVANHFEKILKFYGFKTTRS